MKWQMFVLLFLLPGCTILHNEYEQKLNGCYNLYADQNTGMYVACNQDGANIGVVRESVFAVAQNDSYIIVKQHPKTKDAATPDKKITNYYIIPLKSKVARSCDDNKLGPYTFAQFQQKKKELNIPDIEFSIVFKELE